MKRGRGGEKNSVSSKRKGSRLKNNGGSSCDRVPVGKPSWGRGGGGILVAKRCRNN